MGQTFRLKIIIATFGLFLVAGVLIFRRVTPSIPTDVRKAADTFIIQEIGKTEFEAHYRLVPQKFLGCGETSECSITYRFAPADPLGGSEYTLSYNKLTRRVQYPTNQEQGLETTRPVIDFPSCAQDRNACRFTQTKSDLQRIARRENLNPDRFLMEMYEGQIAVGVSFCDLRTLNNRVKILVSPVTGDILWRGENLECVGQI